MNWKLDLTVTFGLGAGIGGQYQIGTLTNLTTGEHRAVSAAILGLDLGESMFVTAAGERRPAGRQRRRVLLPTPPGAVDFDWFAIASSCSLPSGCPRLLERTLDGAISRNPDGQWPEASFADYPLGLTFGAGGMALIGFFFVDS